MVRDLDSQGLATRLPRGGSAGGLGAQALYRRRATLSVANDSQMILYVIFIALLSRGWRNHRPPLGLRSFLVEHLPSPPQAGAPRSTVSSSACLMQCLWLTTRRSGLCALCSQGRGSAAPSREHGLAQVLCGTPVALPSETYWPECHPAP